MYLGIRLFYQGYPELVIAAVLSKNRTKPALNFVARNPRIYDNVPPFKILKELHNKNVEFSQKVEDWGIHPGGHLKGLLVADLFNIFRVWFKISPQQFIVRCYNRKGPDEPAIPNLPLANVVAGGPLVQKLRLPVDFEYSLPVKLLWVGVSRQNIPNINTLVAIGVPGVWPEIQIFKIFFIFRFQIILNPIRHLQCRAIGIQNGLASHKVIPISQFYFAKILVQEILTLLQHLLNLWNLVIRKGLNGQNIFNGLALPPYQFIKIIFKASNFKQFGFLMQIRFENAHRLQVVYVYIEFLEALLELYQGEPVFGLLLQNLNYILKKLRGILLFVD